MTCKEAIEIIETLKESYSKEAASSENIEVALSYAIDALVILHINLEEGESCEDND